MNNPIITFIVWVVSIIGMGVAAWNITEPESFIGAIGFLFIWSILSSVCGYLLTAAVIMLFGDN